MGPSCSSVKVTFKNIFETILDQLGFRICDINVLSLFVVVLHYSSLVKTHVVKSVNV